MRRHRLALALAVAFTLGASSLTNGSLGSLTGSADQQDDATPEPLDLAQLGATEAGSVDPFYLGAAAEHTNWVKLDESLLVGGSASDFTAGKPHDFVDPTSVGSIGLGDDADTGFALCTDGGASMGSFGGCAYDDAPSLSELSYGMLGHVSDVAGFRSLGFATSDDALSAAFMSTHPLSFVTPSIGTSSSSWGLFLDDSGVPNDYKPDDFGAITNVDPVGVPEPATISLLGIGLLGVAAVSRRRARK